ncbi:preprotein translocase subunit SecG [Alphaproteobacteria bacterium]|mgnify:CR=1 FL=1|nr:preprotein translocase subunit SecG [Alphaproteobacteria bacterium]
MSTVLLVIHLIIAFVMIVLVMLQRSEGGALGIGGGGGGISSRAIGNVLTRTTAILAAAFFVTSIGLTVLGTMDSNKSILDGVVEPVDSQGILAPAPVLPDSDLPVPSN